jgi:hypothetical protein
VQSLHSIHLANDAARRDNRNVDQPSSRSEDGLAPDSGNHVEAEMADLRQPFEYPFFLCFEYPFFLGGRKDWLCICLMLRYSSLLLQQDF